MSPRHAGKLVKDNPSACQCSQLEERNWNKPARVQAQAQEACGTTVRASVPSALAFHQKHRANVIGQTRVESLLSCRIHQPLRCTTFLKHTEFAIGKLAHQQDLQVQDGPALRQAVDTREGGKHLLQQLEDLDRAPCQEGKACRGRICQVLHSKRRQQVFKICIKDQSSTPARVHHTATAMSLCSLQEIRQYSSQTHLPALQNPLPIMQSITCISPR